MALAMLAVALMLANVGLYYALTVVENDDADAQLAAVAATVSGQVKEVDGGVTYAGGDLPHETAKGVAVDVAVVGRNGILATTTDTTLPRTVLGHLAEPTLQTGRQIWVDVMDSGGATRRAYVAPVEQTSGQDLAVVVSASLDEFQAAVMRGAVVAGGLSFLIVIAGGALVYSLVGKALSPVGRIAGLADTLSERDLHRRVDIRTPDDELGELVRTFNRMLGRLQASFDALRAFTANASHELRSPLARMGSELELSLNRPRSTAEYRSVQEFLLGEVHHMTAMVERLLLLARADAGQLAARREAVDVADFLHETAARWYTVAETQGVNLEVDAPSSGVLQADPDLTRRILENLTDNALRHAPPGSRVRVSARLERHRWLFQVADQGHGIAPDRRDRVFARFGRADEVRTREAQSGTGLGLALSATFARLQGGDLRLVDAPGWGAVFELSLPDTSGQGAAR
jgi:two-component system OmpR family sensor kinase